MTQLPYKKNSHFTKMPQSHDRHTDDYGMGFSGARDNLRIVKLG